MNIPPFVGRSAPLAALLLASLGFGELAWGAGAQPGPLDARTWDQTITIPEGRYRASRPIDLVGEIDAVVEPGAFLDGIEFTSSKRQPHWKIDGAFLREVKISGDLGTNLQAKNSVFEKCSFWKGGAWFVAWWSTRWKFENCVFTRIFMSEGRLSATDYSVVASDCTFIGVRFPTYEFKGDCKYVRGSDLVLERCRFIRCNFPPSFLALTRDCVFENCTFSSEGSIWPREAVAQAVLGYFKEGSTAPRSYENRQFTVKFLPAPAEFKAGSSLDFKENAGTVTLSTLPMPPTYTPIGSLARKKASELN